MSEYTEIIDEQEYGKHKTPLLVQTLTQSKTKNKTVLEILIKGAGYEYISKQNWIIDHRGDIILPGELIDRYGLMDNSTRCPTCMVPKSWDTIFAHLQSNYEHGHNLSTKETIKYFSDEFWNWTYRDGKFEK